MLHLKPEDMEGLYLEQFVACHDFLKALSKGS